MCTKQTITDHYMMPCARRSYTPGPCAALLLRLAGAVAEALYSCHTLTVYPSTLYSGSSRSRMVQVGYSFCTTATPPTRHSDGTVRCQQHTQDHGEVLVCIHRLRTTTK
jgi:hypothetical protein